MSKSSKLHSAENIAIKIGIVSIVLNIILASSKIAVGSILNYTSITSDAVHGFSDVFTTVIAILAIKISNRKIDDKYNYGYERYSSIFSVVLAVVLTLVALSLGVEAIEGFFETGREKVQIDALFYVTIGILVGSILFKIGMFFMTRRGAKLAKSDAMLADAWHQLIDALSSIGAIGGLVGGIYGVFFLDSIFTLFIVVMILKVCFDIGVKGVRELTDHAVNSEELESVKADIESALGKDRLLKMKSRIFADKYYIEITIGTLENATVASCYAEATKLKEELLAKHEALKDIHIDFLPK